MVRASARLEGTWFLNEFSQNSEGSSQNERGHVLSDAVLTAVVESYYPEIVRSAGTARTRAQMAQTVVTIFAGGLLAAFTVTNLAQHSIWTKGCAVAAVSLWFAAAVFYVRAVAVPLRREDPRGVRSVELVRHILDKARSEGEQVDKRQAHANIFAILALVATVVTYSLALFLPPVVRSAPGVLVLTEEGNAAVQDVCPGQEGTLEGNIGDRQPADKFLSVGLDGEQCGREGRVTVRIPESAVEVLVVEGK